MSLYRQIWGAAHNICNLRYTTQREIQVVLHNDSNYGYNLLIKEIAEEFGGNIECLGENTEKYITFKTPLKKINENGELITYKLKFVDSCRFMATSLSSLTDNLSEINNKDCKKCMERNKIKSACKYVNHKDNRLICKSKNCDDRSYKSINELITKFPNTYQFCNNDLNKFLLLLRKGVYPYKYMDTWEKFNEAELPSKKCFYSNLNLEDITDEDYIHAQKVWDTFKIKKIGEYHDIYVQLDTVQLADVFEKFWETCIEIYQLDPAHFLSAPGLAWQACLKKANVKLELLADHDMLLMIEAGIRSAISKAIHRYAKANNKYMKNFNKDMLSSFLMYLDANNLYGWAICKKLPVGEFEWIHPEDYTEEMIKN